MKAHLFLLLIPFICCVGRADKRTYVGSTPAHALIRDFLGIPLTDSIDFIRWKLETEPGGYRLQCRYGLAKAGTPGFSNEQKVAFEGMLSQSGNQYILDRNGKSLSILEVNRNLLHFLDRDKSLLAGNGGYSYALNNSDPVESGEFNIPASQRTGKSPLVFEGRTPCRELAALLGLTKGEACVKLKWYFLFYSDSLTGKPTHFLMAGMGYSKKTMPRGHWDIVTEPDGRIIYRVHLDGWARPLNLLKGDDNVLFFIDADKRPLVGNEDFSYTLNRNKEE